MNTTEVRKDNATTGTKTGNVAHGEQKSPARSITRSLVWRGALAIGIGVVSVAWPNITVGAFVILFAIYAVVAAAMYASRAFSSDSAGPVVGYLLLSLLSVAAAGVAIVWPNITALALTWWVAAWALVTGVIEIALAFRQGEKAGERAMWVLSGLISVALGVVLAIRPDIGAVSLATVFGLFSIVSGVWALVLAAQLRSVKSTVRDLAHLTS